MNDDTEKILIFFKDFPDSALYYEAIKEWKQNPFDDILITDVGMQQDQQTLMQRFRFSYDKLNFIKQYWKSNLNDNPGGYKVYSFNDDTVEAQFLYKKNIHEQNYYLEEGLTSYFVNPKEKSIKFYIKLILRKLLFGLWVQRPYPLGSSTHTSTMYSYYPDFVVEPLRKKIIHQISPTIFSVLEKEGFLTILKKRLNIPEIEDRGPIGIILFPICTSMSKNHLDTVPFAQKILDFFKSKGDFGKNIYIKCHPRDPESTTIQLQNAFPELKFIRPNVAAEILFAIIKEKVHHHKLIVSPGTAAFINARIILGDDAEIVCIQNIFQEFISSNPFYDKLKIQLRMF